VEEGNQDTEDVAVVSAGKDVEAAAEEAVSLVEAVLVRVPGVAGAAPRPVGRSSRRRDP